MTTPPAKRLARLAAISPEGWDEYQLLKDPLCRRLDSGGRLRFARIAAAVAADALARLRRSFGEQSPEEYARLLGITIGEEQPSGFGRLPFLSLAVQKPPGIVISSEALGLATDQIRENGLDAVWSPETDWRAIAVAHELFHHLEWREQSLAAVIPEITTFRLGPIHLRGRPAAAEEVAAVHFSQLLSGCSARPDALEIFFLAATNPPVAERWLDLLESL